MVAASATAFDWDKLSDALKQDDKIPPNSVTAKDFARRYDVSREMGGRALLTAVEAGYMERVRVKNEYYYFFKELLPCPSGTPSSKSPAKSTSKSKPTRMGRPLPGQRD